MSDTFSASAINSNLFLLNWEVALRRFFSNTWNGARLMPVKIVWVVVLVTVIVLILCLSPIIIPFILWGRLYSNKAASELEKQTPRLIEEIQKMSPSQLKEKEIKIASILQYINTNLADGEGGYLLKESRNKEVYSIIGNLNLIMAEIKRSQIIDLRKAGLSDTEIAEYNKRLSPLRDIWENE
ncbi:MAG: hypothetical protein ACK5Z2_18860 [Bacteroidota bacterium]|jgi:hypothetical protein